jgi:hypothetical protein
MHAIAPTIDWANMSAPWSAEHYKPDLDECDGSFMIRKSGAAIA